MLSHLVKELMLATRGRTAVEDLTQESFDRWDHAYIFDAMRDLRYGQSFCNHFGITDNHVYYERNIEKCRTMIKQRYLG